MDQHLVAVMCRLQGEEGNLFYVVEAGTLSVNVKPEDSLTGQCLEL